MHLSLISLVWDREKIPLLQGQSRPILPDLSSALHFPTAMRRVDGGEEEDEVEAAVSTTSTTSSSSIGEEGRGVAVVTVRVDGMLVELVPNTMFAVDGCCMMVMVMVSLVVVGLIVVTIWDSETDVRLL